MPTTGDLARAAGKDYIPRPVDFRRQLKLGICESLTGIMGPIPAAEKARIEGLAQDEERNEREMADLERPEVMDIVESEQPGPIPEALANNGLEEEAGLPEGNTPEADKPRDNSNALTEPAGEASIPEAENPLVPAIAAIAIESPRQRRASAKKRVAFSSAEQNPAEEDQIEDRPQKRSRMRKSTHALEEWECECSEEVPNTWKRKVLSSARYDLHSSCKILQEMFKYNRICQEHRGGVGSHMGMRIEGLSNKELLQRLQKVKNSIEDGKLGMLKTNKTTFCWFKKTDRPLRPLEGLGSYKFIPEIVDLTHDWKVEDALATYGEGAVEQILYSWNSIGTVCVDTFAWWWADGCQVGRIVIEEMEMYRHHLRRTNDYNGEKYLPNMVYSIGQQLMRQDPRHYALQVALRSDRNTKLISYPHFVQIQGGTGLSAVHTIVSLFEIRDPTNLYSLGYKGFV